MLSMAQVLPPSVLSRAKAYYLSLAGRPCVSTSIVVAHAYKIWVALTIRAPPQRLEADHE